MKPPCVVDFYLLSTEWSKNLFTIIIMDYKTADEKLPRIYALTFLLLPEDSDAGEIYLLPALRPVVLLILLLHMHLPDLE